MLSDKLATKQEFVQKREQFETAYQEFVAQFSGGHAANCGARLNALLMLHAELVQAPILYTLRSAAEVGFAHAQIQPAENAKTGESTDE